jgi:PAS domain S-box-containing protein
MLLLIKQLLLKFSGSLGWRLFFVGLALNTAVVLWTVYSLQDSRSHYDVVARTMTQNMAQMMDQNVTASVEKIDLALFSVVDELEEHYRERGQLNTSEIEATIDANLQRLPELSSIRIANAEGMVFLGNGVSIKDKASWADRDFFPILRDQSDRGLFVTKPIMGRVNKIWIISFVRRFDHADGRFAGVISASVPIEYFGKLLSNLDVGPNGVALLRDADFGLIARHPALDAAAGRVGAKGFSKELQEAIASKQNSVTFHSKTTADGIERINSYRRLSKAPFHLVTGLGSADYLVPWKTEVRRTLAAILFFILITSGGGWMLWQSMLKLRRATEHSQLLLRSASDGIHILDPQGTLIEASDSFCNMLGYTRAELTGMNISQWDDQLSDTERKAALARASALTDLELFETRHRRKDGSLLDVEVNVLGLVFDGKPILFASSRDITGRKQAQIEAQRSMQLLRAAIDSIDEAFVLYDPHDKLVFCNDKYRSLYATSSDLIVPGAAFEDIVRIGAQRNQYAAAIGRVDEWVAERMLAHHSGNMTLVQKLDDGRVLRILERKLPDGHTVGFRMDITELVKATEEAQAANLAKSRFLATMSHEIRTPMNGVLGMAQLLLQEGLPEDKRLHYARTILSSGKTLLALLNDILDLSKIEAGKFKLESTVFEPAALLSDIHALFLGATRAKQLQLDHHWQANVQQSYQGDAYRLRQMLSNLVGNAVKFTARGRVSIQGHEIERQGDMAVLEFSVTDTGLGIPSDRLDLLFKPFSQADNSITREFGGSGLGLSIVRNLARAMGGDVVVESEPGKGSRFWFRVQVRIVNTLPEAAANMPKHGTQAKPAQDTSTVLQGHVLVAEDNAVNAVVIKSLLDGLGLSVTLVNDGQEAVQALLHTQLKPPVDLVLMDLQMPVMDGYAATQKIRHWEADKQQARLPIIALTADAFEEDRQHCMAVGMDDFLTKPIAIDALTMALDRWLPKVTAPMPATPPAELKPPDMTAFNALILELTPLLEQNKFDAINSFNKLRALTLETSFASEVNALELLLQNMRFDLVLERLRQITANVA